MSIRSFVTIRGSILPYLQDETWDYDPTRGYIHRMMFRGASRNNLLATQQDFARNGIACRLQYNQGGTSSLDVEDSTMQYTLDNWELLANKESRDGFSHPWFLEALTDAETAETQMEDMIALLRQHLENKDTPDDAFQDPKLAALVGSVIPVFYGLNQRGSSEYRHHAYVLRHTTNAPARWTTNIADDGVDMIYSPAQLLTECEDSGLWVSPLPARLSYKIANFPEPEYKANYMWGWLKDGSTESTAANNRIAIVTEYTLEQWSTIYYEPY